MRIVFIGTSHGVPEANQRCSCTMIEVAGNRYFIDMGTQAIEDLRRRHIPVESVKGVFLTHMHGDHTDGVISFVDIINWYFTKADPVIFFPEERAIHALRGWIDINGTPLGKVRLDVVKEGVTYEDDALRVKAFRTKHCAVSYAYLVEAEGKRILFTGDQSVEGPDKDFPYSVLEQKTDLVVCEGAHFPATAYREIFSRGSIGQVCYTHYAPWNVPNILEMKRVMAPLSVSAATDGMEIVL